MGQEAVEDLQEVLQEARQGHLAVGQEAVSPCARLRWRDEASLHHLAWVALYWTMLDQRVPGSASLFCQVTDALPHLVAWNANRSAFWDLPSKSATVDAGVSGLLLYLLFYEIAAYQMKTDAGGIFGQVILYGTATVAGNLAGLVTFCWTKTAAGFLLVVSPAHSIFEMAIADVETTHHVEISVAMRLALMPVLPVLPPSTAI
jgi:hypothetical protein